MKTKAEFLRIMAVQTEMALATSVDNIPNVRIVNFYFSPDSNILYFATYKGNDKVKELAANEKIAFSTIPHGGNEHVKAKGIATKSKLTIFDLAKKFVERVPDYQDTIDAAGKSLVLYEIKFDTAVVTLDLEHIRTIKL